MTELKTELTDVNLLIEKLRKSEERFESFLVNSSEQMFCVEFTSPIPLGLPEDELIECLLDQGVFVEANEAFAKVYDATLDDVIGWPLEKTLSRELPTTIPFLQDVIRSNFDVTDIESSELGADGQEKIILNTIRPTIVDGQLVRVWGTARDVTEARDTQEAIRLRSTAIETMRDGCVIIDAQAKDMPIIYANDQFTEITKYPLSDCLGRNCRFLQGPETSPEVTREIRDAIAGNRPFQGELLNYRKDGKKFWNFLRLTPVFDSGGVLTHYVGVQSDITGRKLYEKALRQKNVTLESEIETRKKAQKQLEELSARLIDNQEEELRRLARELHDDFTQRIAALAMEAARVAGEIPDFSKDIRENLNQISNDLSALAVDTQERSRQLHPKIIEELGLAKAIAAECRRFAKRTGIGIDLSADECENSLHPDVSLSAYRILQEALSNVVKHAQALQVTVKLFEDSTSVALHIHDNGIGFDQKGNSMSGSLGLISMAERARYCQGNFEIESSPGVGTTVRVNLPTTTETLQ